MLMSSQVSIPLEKGIEAMGRQEFARGHSGEQVSEAAALGSYSFSCAPHWFLTQLSVRKQHCTIARCRLLRPNGICESPIRLVLGLQQAF